MLLLKVCILLDWIHIFAPSHGVRGRFYWTCISNIIVSVLFYTACVFVEIFACIPRSKIWNTFDKGTCVNVFIVPFVTGVFNLILDVVMLVMPLSVIWRLHLSRPKKIAVSMLFGVGTL
jgi:hypothetical protein